MADEPHRAQYRQIADQLRASIASGEYPAGSQMPSEPELEVRYGVSRPTINRAFTVLRNEGLIRTEQGRGTWVHPIPAIIRAANQRYSQARREDGGASRGAFDTEVRALGFEPRSDLVEVGPVRPPAEVAAALNLAGDDVALIRRRHMYAGDVPVQVATSYVPWDIARDTQLTQADTGPGGTYSRLAELGHPVARFSERITVRTPADDEGGVLRLGEEQSVFDVFHVAYDQNGAAVEVTIHVMPIHQWVLDYEWPAEPAGD